MNELNLENYITYLPYFLSLSVIIVLLVCVFKLKDKAELTGELESIIVSQDRYIPKPASGFKKDTNRFGRWKVKLLSGEEQTMIGFLSTVLENHDIATYKEIK